MRLIVCLLLKMSSLQDAAVMPKQAIRDDTALVSNDIGESFKLMIL